MDFLLQRQLKPNLPNLGHPAQQASLQAIFSIGHYLGREPFHFIFLNYMPIQSDYSGGSKTYMRVGTSKSSSFPWPSWPLVPIPQTYNSPKERIKMALVQITTSGQAENKGYGGESFWVKM